MRTIEDRIERWNDFLEELEFCIEEEYINEEYNDEEEE